eukprot:3436499-Rhodomonas_salina.1
MPEGEFSRACLRRVEGEERGPSAGAAGGVRAAGVRRRRGVRDGGEGVQAAEREAAEAVCCEVDPRRREPVQAGGGAADEPRGAGAGQDRPPQRGAVHHEQDCAVPGRVPAHHRAAAGQFGAAHDRRQHQAGHLLLREGRHRRWPRRAAAPDGHAAARHYPQRHQACQHRVLTRSSEPSAGFVQDHRPGCCRGDGRRGRGHPGFNGVCLLIPFVTVVCSRPLLGFVI